MRVLNIHTHDQKSELQKAYSFQISFKNRSKANDKLMRFHNNLLQITHTIIYVYIFYSKNHK